MSVTKSALKDNIIVGVLLVMMVILSFTSITAVRTSKENRKILTQVERCILPQGDLCKGDAVATKVLVDSIVKQINDHTDQVVGK